MGIGLLIGFALIGVMAIGSMNLYKRCRFERTMHAIESERRKNWNNAWE